MRSLFTSTFQPARRAALNGYRPAFARSAPPALGVTVMANERNAILQTIATGEERIAAVRKWIATRIDADPMLLRTFGQQHISDNFWGYNELVDRDQYYVNQAKQTLAAELEDWDLSEETVSRVDEWGAVIDIMYGAMQEYGKTPLITAAGATVPGTAAPTGTAPPPPGAPAGRVPAGANVNTPPPSTGISGKQALTYGAIGLGAIALIALAKKYL